MPCHEKRWDSRFVYRLTEKRVQAIVVNREYCKIVMQCLPLDRRMGGWRSSDDWYRGLVEGRLLEQLGCSS